MKIIFRTAVIAALLVTASCSKDNNDTKAEQSEEQAEQLEKTPLEANTVSDNVLIQGGTKKVGVPPTPNEAISLSIANTGKTALLNEGFKLSLNSDASITGAYLRFKEADGEVADSYYEIDLTANAASGKRLSFSKSNRKHGTFSTAKNDVSVLDVDFTTLIEPGTFCYEICVFDADGNISAPQEVCATVESWGGNAEIVGSWDMTKQEYTEEGVKIEEVVGEEFCYDDSIQCDDQEIFEFQICSTTELGNISFKADGSFTTDFKGVENALQYEASWEQCQAIFGEDEEYLDRYKGFWAYSSTTSKLTLVAYENTYTEGAETETEIYENGNGELLFDGIIELSGTVMVISQEDDYDQDGTVDDLYISYFEKN
jgi:hypothetical protein